MPLTVDDVDLMARVASGESAAQLMLVRKLLRRVQRLCRALLRNAHDAQDAAQVSMLEILQAARGFRGDSSLERWADRITVRTALRASRKEKRLQRTPVDAEPERVSAPVGEHAVLAQEYLRCVSERQRTVLILRHGFEYSIDEIADLTGISPNTVKDRLLRGRGLMRKMFRREEFLRDAPLQEADEAD
jgi:RNA polymerase sigma factor (sigma-70 family)